MARGSTGSRDATRARLVASAREVFTERGFHGASIGELCTRAGLTRGAFYSNFASKDELFYALFDAQGERLVGRLRAALAEAVASDDPVNRFLALSRPQDDEDRDWYVLSMEFTLHAIREPAAAAALAEHDAYLRREVASVIRSLMEAAGRELLVDPDLIARIATALREGSSAQAYVEPLDPDPLMIERLVLPVLLSSMSRRIATDPDEA